MVRAPQQWRRGGSLGKRCGSGVSHPTRQGHNHVGESICNYVHQTKSSRSNRFESSSSDALEVSREFLEQHLPATGRHSARTDDGLRVRDYLMDGAQHLAGVGRAGVYTQGRQEGSTKDVGSASECNGRNIEQDSEPPSKNRRS